MIIYIYILLSCFPGDQKLLPPAGQEGSNSWISTFWELPYVETLQLSLNAFKDLLSMTTGITGAVLDVAAKIGR